jgi:hypothetical protein
MMRFGIQLPRSKNLYQRKNPGQREPAGGALALVLPFKAWDFFGAKQQVPQAQFPRARLCFQDREPKWRWWV